MECNRRQALKFGIAFVTAVALARCAPEGADDESTARGRSGKFRILTAQWEYGVPATFQLFEDGTLIKETTELVYSFERKTGQQKCYKLRAVVNGLLSEFTNEVCITV